MNEASIAIVLPRQAATAIIDQPASQAEVVVMPIGRMPVGGGGAPSRFDVASPAATWIIPHHLGRAPIVQVFTGAGEKVIADVFVDAVNITVVFAAPVAGFVLAY